MTGVIAFGQMATAPTNYDVPPLADNEQRLTLKTADGVNIEASLFPVDDKEAPVILLLHGNGASRGQFRGHIPWLNEAGYAAMSIDFRGHGQSAAERKSFGWNEARDAEAALTWIKAERPDSKIGVIGISLGGAAILLSKNVATEADSMILQAVYPDLERAIGNRISVQGHPILSPMLTPLLTQQSRFRFGVAPDAVSPIDAATRFGNPVLVIGGENDVYTPVAESEALTEAFAGKHWLWIVGKLDHAQISDLNNAEYIRRVLLFFDETLRE